MNTKIISTDTIFDNQKISIHEIHETMIIEVTPKLAEVILKKDHTYRKYTNDRANHYARLYEEGKWYEGNGETLKFDKDKYLIDGKHRLKAIIKYGKPVKHECRFDIPSEAAASLDCGRARTGGDIASAHGMKKPNYTSAAVTNYEDIANRLPYGRGDRRYNTGRYTKNKRANVEIDFLCKKYRDIDDYLVYDGKKFGVGTPGELTALKYAFCKINPIAGNVFMEYLLKGTTKIKNYPEFNPLINKLRNMLNANTLQGAKNSKFKYSSQKRMALIILTWNYFIKGIEKAHIKWDENDNLPYPEG